MLNEQELQKARCPICKEMISLRYGKFVYHKVRWPKYNCRAVPCNGVGLVPQSATEKPTSEEGPQ